MYEKLDYCYESNELNLKYLTDKRLFEMDLMFQWGEWILVFAQVSLHRYLLRELNKSYIRTVAHLALDVVLSFDLHSVSVDSSPLIYYSNDAPMIQMHTWDWILERPTVEVACHLSVVMG